MRQRPGGERHSRLLDASFDKKRGETHSFFQHQGGKKVEENPEPEAPSPTQRKREPLDLYCGQKKGRFHY